MTISILFFILGTITFIIHAFTDKNYDMAIFYMVTSAASSLIDIARGMGLIELINVDCLSAMKNMNDNSITKERSE